MFYSFLQILVIILTAFQFGWNSGSINQPRAAMSQNCTSTDTVIFPDCIPMNDLEWGTFVSIFLVGGVIGGLAGGSLAQAYGRKATLLWNNLFFIVGGLFLSISGTLFWLCIGRLLVGLGAGIGTAVVPIYIAELSPIEYRGAFGSMNQLSIVVGVLISQVIGIPLSTKDNWRILLGLTILPSVIQLFLLPFCVETPIWLASKGRVTDARLSLSSIREDEDEVDEELDAIMAVYSNHYYQDEEENIVVDIQDDLSARTSRDPMVSEREQPSVKAESYPETMTLVETFRSQSLRRSLISVFLLHFIQQFSGINAATYYSATIFNIIFPNEIAIQLSLLNSLAITCTTVVSVFLVDRLGRRTLTLSSIFGMFIFAMAIAIGDFVSVSPVFLVVCLIFFVALFGIGLGSVPWLILPELIPTYALGPVSSTTTGLNWLCCFIIALFTPSVISWVGYGIFFIFGGCLMLVGILLVAILPETKGRTADQLVGYDYQEVSSGQE